MGTARMRRALCVAFVVACRPEPAAVPVTAAPSAVASVAPVPSETASVAPTPVPNASSSGVPVGSVISGVASWYGDALKGHKTASGERFDPSGLTAAHRTLPIGTWVEVTRPGTGLSVRVRINDRGPLSPRFIIDLSRGAAEKLGMVRMGVANVELRVLSGP